MNRASSVSSFSVPRRVTLGRNALALYVLQLANYVIPIVTLPYLIRVLGPEMYGAIAIAYSVVFFMVLFVDAGFNTCAVRELSQPDISHDRINKIYAGTQWLKLAMALLCLALLILLVVVVPVFRQDAALFLVSFMLVIGSLLFPTWLFQGLEIMHVTMLCSISGRLLTTCAIFTLVKGPEDLILAALFQASATAVSGLMSARYVYREMGLKLLQPLSSVRSACRDSVTATRSLWVSEFCTNSISNSGVFILSWFVSDAAVGVYAAIEKISRAALSAFQPLQKALFPRVAGYWLNEKLLVEYRNTWATRLTLLALIIATGLYLLAPISLVILFGASWAAYADLLRIMSLWLLLAVTVTTFSQFWLLASGNRAHYSRVLMVGAAVQLVLSINGAALFGVKGFLIALTAAEAVRLLCTFYAMKIQNSGSVK